MPDIPIQFPDGGKGIITVAGEYKPGDPPPEHGYCDWFEWAEVQHNAGLRQEKCGRCGLWRYPQEMSETIDVSRPFKIVKGKQVFVTIKSPVCLECDRLAQRKGGE